MVHGPLRDTQETLIECIWECFLPLTNNKVKTSVTLISCPSKLLTEFPGALTHLLDPSFSVLILRSGTTGIGLRSNLLVSP